MTLYEIDKAIYDAIDEETGEVDPTVLSQLEMERDKKIANICLLYKNICADAEAYKKEKMAFAKRQQVAENKAEGLKRYLDSYLNGMSWDNDEQKRCRVRYRSSISTEVNMEIFGHYANRRKFLKIEEKPDKELIKEYLETHPKGMPGCALVEKNNIQIQ